MLADNVRINNQCKEATYLHELFQHQAMLSPDSVAIRYHDQEISYLELGALSDKLAQIIALKQLPTNSAVPIVFSNPIYYVISILAILKSGHFYVPLSLSMASNRLNIIIRQLNNVYLLTDTATLKAVEIEHESLLNLDEVLMEADASLPKKLDSRLRKDALCYMIYTSGSTGEPKGVLMEHAGPVNIVRSMNDISSLKENEYFIQNVNFGFDPHVWTLFWPLFSGATVILLNEHEQHDVVYLISLIKKYNIRVLHAGVSLAKALLKLPDIKDCCSLRQIIGGGEAWPLSVLQTIKKILPLCELINVYGPTESCVHVSTWSSSQAGHKLEHTVPIGKAIANTEIYILDDNLNKVVGNEKGEIYISGVGIARGYYGDAVHTDSKFISNPYNDGLYGKLYKSGDFGRFNSDGNIEFLGRVDNQVQIHGHRVEISEVECAIVSYPSIVSAAVITTTINDNLELVAFVEPDENIKDDDYLAQSIIHFLSSKLPTYMFPKKIIITNEWPLTIQGKIDKSKLEHRVGDTKIVRNDSKESYSIQEELYGIWREVLTIENIEYSDDFFQIGGDSLNAIDIVAKINHKFDVDFSISAIFENSTIEKLSSLVIECLKNKKTVIPLINTKNNDATSTVDLSLNQKRLIRTSNALSSLNNGIIQLRISGEFDASILEEAAITLTKTHEILRANVIGGAEGYLQIANEIDKCFIKNIHLYSEKEQPLNLDSALALSNKYLEMDIDISSDPLFQLVIIHYAKNEWLLVIYLNHIITDYYTSQFIVNELLDSHKNTRKKDGSNIADVNQFRDYVIAEHEFYQSSCLEKQKQYWLSVLLRQPRVVKFTNYKTDDLSAGFACLKLTDYHSKKIKCIASKNKISLFTVLITIFAASIYDYTSQERFVVAFTYAQRQKAKLKSILGPLANKLLLSYHYSSSGQKNLSQLINLVNIKIQEILKYSDIQIETIRDMLVEREGDQFCELFNVLFDYEKIVPFNRLIDVGVTACSIMARESSQVKRHMSVRVLDDERNLTFNIRYRNKIFSDKDIKLFIKIIQDNCDLLAQECLEDANLTC